jgi:hypothetical protein
MTVYYLGNRQEVFGRGRNPEKQEMQITGR